MKIWMAVQTLLLLLIAALMAAQGFLQYRTMESSAAQASWQSLEVVTVCRGVDLSDDSTCDPDTGCYSVFEFVERAKPLLGQGCFTDSLTLNGIQCAQRLVACPERYVDIRATLQANDGQVHRVQ